MCPQGREILETWEKLWHESSRLDKLISIYFFIEKQLDNDFYSH